MSYSKEIYRIVVRSGVAGIKATVIADQLSVNIDSVSGILSRLKRQNRIINQDNLWRKTMKTIKKSMSPSIIENINLIEDRIAEIHNSGDIGTEIIPSEIYMRAMERIRFLRQLSLYLHRFYNEQF